VDRLRKTPGDQHLEEMAHHLDIHIDHRNVSELGHNYWGLVEGLEAAVDS